ncbi:hypothetical protein AYI70_g8859, partial [Smittium culicis]
MGSASLYSDDDDVFAHGFEFVVEFGVNDAARVEKVDHFGWLGHG